MLRLTVAGLVPGKTTLSPTCDRPATEAQSMECVGTTRITGLRWAGPIGNMQGLAVGTRPATVSRNIQIGLDLSPGDYTNCNNVTRGTEFQTIQCRIVGNDVPIGQGTHQTGNQVSASHTASPGRHSLFVQDFSRLIAQ